jgi:hypothetical protein
MGSIVKSIGKAIKKIGKFIKKAAPYILMAVALYAGIAAYGAYTASAAASTAVAGSAAAVAGSTAATTGLNMFSWTNFTTGASAIGSGITGMFSGGGSGTGAVANAAKATGPTTGAFEAEFLTQAVSPTASGGGIYEGVKNWMASAIDGNKGYALLAGSQLLGTGISAIAAAFDDTEEQKLAFAEKQLKQQGTRYGFAPDEGRTPDQMPADSPFWMGYNQNLAMNAGAPVPGKFAHGIRQPTTSNRRTLNYDYSPRGVVTQSAAKTFNQRPTGMININNKPGVLNA